MTELVKLRLTGSSSASAAALLTIAKALRDDPALDIAEISDPYPNRRGGGERRYITIIVQDKE